MLILGAGGQVGRALTARFPNATALDRSSCNISAPELAEVDWAAQDVVINAAAYTAVDAAEAGDGRAESWLINAVGPARLSALAREHGFTLVHFSTKYVFDGTHDGPIPETAAIAPLSAYGAPKAAGDLAVTALERTYLVRPTLVVGEGRNFVRTMLSLASRGLTPAVVEDQIGRLTFASDIADAVAHLLEVNAETGIYNLTNSGDAASWADVARETFRLGWSRRPHRRWDHDSGLLRRQACCRRPARNSVLDLQRVKASGFKPRNWRHRLADYIAQQYI